MENSEEMDKMMDNMEDDESQPLKKNDKGGIDVDPNVYYPFESNGEKSEARDEFFLYSICLCTCPRISWLQFIVIISLIEYAVFITTCSIYGLDNSAFLAPNPKAMAWGWSDTKKIRNGYQLWRFFTPTLLHGHLEHIVGNTVAQVYMGSGIEFGIGVVRMSFLYILSGLGGITLSMCVRPAAHGVGASTAVFGLVGYLLSYCFTNFFYMGRANPGQRIFLPIFVSTLILLNLNIGPGSDPHTDNYGHLGGLITGIIAGFSLSEQYDADARSKERTPDRFTEEEYASKSACCCFFRRFCQGLLLLWFVGLFVYFYAFMPIDYEEDPEDEV